MKRLRLHAMLIATLALAAMPSSVFAQVTTGQHDAHHPAGAPVEQAPAVPGGESKPAMPGAMPGMMGMMTPEMMQMMHRMMSGGGMRGSPMAPGDASAHGTGQGQMPMASRPMMCPMMQNMMRPQPAAARHSMMDGPSIFYGMPGEPQEMTPDRVRDLVTHQLRQLGNPRLKIGRVAAAPDGNILAEIVTLDGSLVQKLAFNRYPGLVRQIAD